MTIEKAIRDYQGSFLLGEADGEHWAAKAHANEVQSVSLLEVQDVGGLDIFDRDSTSWLASRAEDYRQRDQRFDPNAYFEGFLLSVRKARVRYSQAAVITTRTK